MSAENRWVKLSQVVPWDKFANVYMAMMSSDLGRPGLSPRVVLGALIIKHLEKLDDRGVIQAIQENAYMQYLIGLKEFMVDPVFDPSLIVEIRKRVGHKAFDTLSADLLHGHYPELVQVDKIYATQENRRWLKERDIRITAPPLGRRPAKEKQSYSQKRKARKKAAERNHIEGTFGQGKNGYALNQIRARLKETSESWVACIFFVMNLIHLEANHFFVSFFRWITYLAKGPFIETDRMGHIFCFSLRNQSRNLRLLSCLT